MIAKAFCVLALAALPSAAFAHGLVVFASSDCEAVLVEAKFSNGRVAQRGVVRVLDGQDVLQASVELTGDTPLRVPLAGLETSGGLTVEVESGGHDNYWILTPDDLAQGCES